MTSAKIIALEVPAPSSAMATACRQRVSQDRKGLFGKDTATRPGSAMQTVDPASVRFRAETLAQRSHASCLQARGHWFEPSCAHHVSAARCGAVRRWAGQEPGGVVAGGGTPVWSRRLVRRGETMCGLTLGGCGGPWLDHDGSLPVMGGTLIRLQMDHLPGDRDPKRRGYGPRPPAPPLLT
jgi:hypothetical protein